MALHPFRRILSYLPRHSIVGRIVHPLFEEWRSLAGFLSWIGIFILILFLFIALFAGFLAPYDPLQSVDAPNVPPWSNASVFRNETFFSWSNVWQNPAFAQSVNGTGTRSAVIGQVEEVWDFPFDLKRDDVRAVGFAAFLMPAGTDAGHYLAVSISHDRGASWSVEFEVRTTGSFVRVDVSNLTDWSAETLDLETFRMRLRHASDGGGPGNLTVDYVGGTVEWGSHWHLMGTDKLGRDVFSRALYGARTSLAIMAIGVSVALVVGFPLGLYSGYRGGALDKTLVLVMDSLYSFPGLLFAGLIAVLLGKGVVNIGLAVTVIYIPLYFRVTRTQVLSAREELYVEAARAVGARPTRIMFRYIARNVLVAIPVIFTISSADAILTAAGLSFLGLGLEGDIPDWGLDLSSAAEVIDNGFWWASFFPGFAIVVLTVGLSFLGEGLNDILNPVLKKERT
jgi:peptide/nickel transport system permease protein